MENHYWNRSISMVHFPVRYVSLPEGSNKNFHRPSSSGSTPLLSEARWKMVEMWRLRLWWNSTKSAVVIYFHIYITNKFYHRHWFLNQSHVTWLLWGVVKCLLNIQNPHFIWDGISWDFMGFLNVIYDELARSRIAVGSVSGVKLFSPIL